MTCIFCDIRDDKIDSFKVWESHDFILLLDINPINPGHLLLIPKRHISYIFNTKEPLYCDIFKMAKKISIILKKILSSERVGLVIEGFGVNHVHIHLVPVNNGNELNPDRAKKISKNELKKMQILFSKRFKKLR